MTSEDKVVMSEIRCSAHHRYKTGFGREARPLLLAYLAGIEAAK